MLLPEQYAWFEPVLIATIVVFIINLVGNSIGFGNRFLGALMSAIVFALVFGTLVYFGYGSVSMSVTTTPRSLWLEWAKARGSPVTPQTLVFLRQCPIEPIARNSLQNPSALDPRSSDRLPVSGSRDAPVRRRAAPDLVAPVPSILAKRFDMQIVFPWARARREKGWIASEQRWQASAWIEQMQRSPRRASLPQRRCQAEVS